MTIPDAAIEAAAEAMNRMPPNKGKNIRPWEDFARVAIEAAMPALREAIAEEIRGFARTQTMPNVVERCRELRARDGPLMVTAARIVRGEDA